MVKTWIELRIILHLVYQGIINVFVDMYQGVYFVLSTETEVNIYQFIREEFSSSFGKKCQKFRMPREMVFHNRADYGGSFIVAQLRKAQIWYTKRPIFKN